MRLMLLTAAGGNAEWLTRLAEAMGWLIDMESPGEQSPTRRPGSVNSEILTALQSTWYHVDNVPLGEDAPALPLPLKQKIEDCARDPDLPDRWLCDDPAMCVVLPYWRGLLEKTMYLLYVEHPVDVAHRLRDAWQFPLAFGVSLWEYYMRAALLHTRGCERVIVVRDSLPKTPEEALRNVGAKLVPFSERGVPGHSELAEIAALFPAASRNQEPDHLAIMHEPQRAFYRALSAGAIDDIAIGPLSAGSLDILQHYGRLRAGFDLVRQDRDALRRRLAVEPLPAAGDADHVAAGAPGTTPPVAEMETEVVEVTVYLRDMDPLALSCQRDNPVLDQLMHALARAGEPDAAGEIFYLELGETTLYFPVSRLLAVETDRDITDTSSRVSPAGPDVDMSEPAAPDTGDGRGRKSVAVLVLGCLLPQYERCLDVIQGTWAAKHNADIDIYYALGAHFDRSTASAAGVEKYLGGAAPALNAFEAKRIGSVIACGCADTIQLQGDCLLRKRLIAFHYLVDTGRYDFVYTVCASSYVHQAGLRAYVDALDGEMLFHGPAGVCEFTGRPYVSGASMLLSMDLVELLVRDTSRILEDNGGRYADDVALGSWIARHFSDTGEEGIVENLRAGRRATGDNTFVMPGPPGMIDYVGVDPACQVRVEGAHHYHFRTDAIEQMAGFHQRCFA